MSDPATVSAITKAAGLFASQAAPRVTSLLLGPPLARVTRAAYQKAVALAVPRMVTSPLGDHLIEAFAREGVQQEVLRFLEPKDATPDFDVIKSEIRLAEVAVDSLQVSLPGLVELIQHQVTVCLQETGEGAAVLNARRSEQTVLANARIEAKLDHMYSAVKSLATATADDPDKAADGPERELEHRMEEAKRQLSGDAPQAALRILGELDRVAREQGVSARFRYRLHVNTGSALLGLQRYGEARESFLRARDYDRDAALPIAQLAQVELIRGRREDALLLAGEALQVDPQSVAAWGVRIQISPDPIELDDLGETLRKDPHILASFASRALFGHDLSTAEEFLRAALQQGKRDPELLFRLGEVIYGRSGATEVTPKTRTAGLTEADRLAAEAVTLLKHTDRRPFLARALVLRALVAIARERPGEAIPYLEDARRADYDNVEARIIAARAHLRLGAPQKALDLLDELKIEEQLALVLEHRVDALVQLGRTKEVEPLIRVALEASPGTWHHEEVLVGLALHATQADLPDLAEEVIERLPSHVKDDWRWVVRARVAEARRDLVGTESAFRSALENAPEDRKNDVATEFAYFLVCHGRPHEALELLRETGAPSRRGPVLQLYARSLFDAGEYAEALELVHGLDAEGGELPHWALRIGAMVESLRDNHPGALPYLEQLYAEFTEDPSVASRLALTRLRTGNREGALSILDALRHREGLEAVTEMGLAEMLHMAGDTEEALKVAFRALQKAPADADQQLAYLKLIHQSEGNIPGAGAAEVGPDTWVRLRDVRSDSRVEYLLLRDLPPTPRAGEMRYDDARVAPLVGARVGGKVTLRQDQPDEATYEVEEVQGALIHTARQIIAHFRLQHPDRTELFTFHSDPETGTGLVELVAQIARTSAMAAEVEAIYRSTPYLPLGACRGSAGGSVRRTYLSMLLSPEMPVHVSDGTPEAQAAGLTAVRRDEVVLTTTGLTTLEVLGRLELLPGLFEKILAPESLLRELAAEAASLASDCRRHMETAHASVDRHGALAVYNVSRDELEREQVRIEGLVCWIRENCAVMPRPLHALGADSDRLREAVGASSFDAHALANTATALFADDLGLRLLTYLRNGAPSFPTFQLLQRAHERGLLGAEDLNGDLAHLVELGHKFVPVDAGLIFASLRAEGFQPSGRALRVLERLGAEHANLDSASTVLVKALREVSITPLASAHLEQIATVALDRFLEGRATIPAAHALRERLANAFRLLPLARERVETRLERLVEERMARPGLVL